MTQPGVPSVPFDKLRLVRQAPAAELYAGVDEVGAAVTVVVLTPAGMADPAVRGAFERAVNAGLYGPVGGPIEVQTADLAAPQPWAAAWTEPGVGGLLSALPAPVSAAPAPYPVEYSIAEFSMPGGEPGSAPPWATPAVMSGPPGAYPPPVPAPAAPVGPPPAGGPARSSVIIVLVGVIVAIVLLGSGTLAAILLTRHSPPANPVAGSTTGTVPTPAATSAGTPAATATTGSPAAPPAPLGSAKPTLRAVPAHSVVGPTFGANDATFTMAFQGWPFAFRTPKTWGCLVATVDKIPDARAWGCIDEGHPGNKEKANLMLRACPTTCTQAERTSMNRDWFDDATKAKQAGDDRTYLVETPNNSKGLYSVDFSRFFGPAPGQLTWQVGVYVEAPSASKADVQKILNDVASQTS